MNTILINCMLYAFAVSARADSGLALVKGTAQGSAVAGTVSFEDTAQGLKIALRVSGLTPGAHGFHIHEWGRCDDAGKAAGGHYNPAHAPHGEALKHGPQKAHAGDTGNIVADEKGQAALDAVLPGVALASGTFTVAGRAVIIHKDVDDFSQPLGNAGGRVACGLIALAPPEPPAAK